MIRKVIMDRGESKGVVFFNKNKGIEEATYDWCFIIDADEKMDEVLQEEIENIVKKNKSPYVYETGFINVEFGKPFVKCDMPNKTFVRLFKKDHFHYDWSKTSEGGDIQVWKGGKSVLKGKLIHNSHPTIAAFLLKINRYSTREAIIQAKKDFSNSMLVFNMFWQPIREFFWKYAVWKLYKEGIHGMVVSFIFAFYHYLIWTKTLEIKLRN